MADEDGRKGLRLIRMSMADMQILQEMEVTDSSGDVRRDRGKINAE